MPAVLADSLRTNDASIRVLGKKVEKAKDSTYSDMFFLAEDASRMHSRMTNGDVTPVIPSGKRQVEQTRALSYCQVCQGYHRLFLLFLEKVSLTDLAVGFVLKLFSVNNVEKTETSKQQSTTQHVCRELQQLNLCQEISRDLARPGHLRVRL